MVAYNPNKALQVKVKYFTTEMEDDLATPNDIKHGLNEEVSGRLLTPSYHLSGKAPRYYQEIAINRTVQAILQGKRRILLTMATATGKTLVRIIGV